MNAYKHSEISVRRRSGIIEDYYSIHDFIDCTKELCSDNRHRILHTMWGVKRVIIPIFGHTIKNSDNKLVNVKDLCEQDHILPDYRDRFIPTLNDFVMAIEEEKDDLQRFNDFFASYKDDKELSDLLLSPLANTGSIKSLLITHNSWFINEIVPKILKREPEIKNFNIKPNHLFDRMRFEPWMNNGFDYPNSAKQNQNLLI